MGKFDALEKYLNDISEYLGKQIGMGGKRIADIQINEVQKRTPYAQVADKYIQRIYFAKKGSGHSTMEITVGSCLSSDDLGSFLVISCIDVIAEWLREACQEESIKSLMSKDFAFVSSNGDKLTPEQAATQIRERSAIASTRQLEAWIGIEFQAIDKLALTPYEGQKPSGGMMIAFWDTNAADVCDCCFEEEIPFDLDHVRLIRKLLVGTGKSGSLVLRKSPDSAVSHVVGICNNSENARDLPVSIHITGWLNWTLSIYGKLLFQSGFSGYTVDTSNESLRADLRNEFGGSSDYSALINVIESIQRQEHGAAAIILSSLNTAAPAESTVEDPRSAAKRIDTLKKHNKAIKVHYKCRPSEDSIKYAAGIDGALILDLQGNVHYVATILDGNSCVEGDIARGSRFNSIRNFVASIAQTSQESIMGIVCSEDGGMNIIPGKTLRQPAPLPPHTEAETPAKQSVAVLCCPQEVSN